MERCGLCPRILNDPADPLSVDCGGDCLGCMREIDAWLEEIEAKRRALIERIERHNNRDRTNDLDMSTMTEEERHAFFGDL